jgi:hypothetical protein
MLYTYRYIPSAMTQGIKIPTCKCERCGYSWYLRYPKKPRVCPRCKSPYWEASSEFVNDLKIDSEKAEKVIDEIAKQIEENSKSLAAWASVIQVGWQRMLETSELPIARVDRIFAYGFSIPEWFMNTYKISEGLARSVANHFAATDKATVIDTEDIIERAEQVLDWQKIVSTLDQETVKVLAVVWFADNLSTEMLLPKTEIDIQRNVWQLLEKGFCKERTDLINHVEEVINTIDSENKDATSWAEVIRFP